MKRTLPSLLLCLLTVLTARAEKAWDDGYRPFQDVAPEYLEIKIIKVTLKDGGSMFSSNSKVELEADVNQVFRSTSGLQQGSRIVINYTRKSQAGPMTLQPSIPREGQTVPAFLRKKSGFYEPAALHHSFEPLTSQQLMQLSKTSTARAMAIALPVSEPEKKQPKVELRPEPRVEVEPVSSPTEPMAIVTAPEPAPALENTAPEPTPAPKKVAAKPKKQPKVTEPIVITKAEKEKKVPDVPVIAESLPARPADPSPETSPETSPEPLPEPTPESKAKPALVAEKPLNLPLAEPIVIKTIQPTPVPDAEPKIATTKVTPIEKPAAPLLSVLEPPAATAPLAPSSAALDQEGLSAYSAIYAKIKQGDRAADSNEKELALNTYKETLLDLERLRNGKPDFQPFIVEYRRKDLARKISALEADPAKK